MNTHLDTCCPSCKTARPAAATFCPFCGAAAPPKVNPRVALELTPTAMFDSPWEPSRSAARVVRAGIALATLAAVTAGVVVGAWLRELEPPARLARTTAVQAPAQATAPPVDAAPQLAVRDTAGGFEVLLDGDSLHTIRTVEGSRYSSLDARKRAVSVRLEHVQAKTTGHFEARTAGPHYEVVWTDGPSTFRVFDVTREDARALETAEPSIVANYVVDRLNAATRGGKTTSPSTTPSS